MGKGAKIATVIAKMDNFGTRNFEGAKPYTINQNGANLVILKIGVKFDRYVNWNADMANEVALWDMTWHPNADLSMT